MWRFTNDDGVMKYFSLQVTSDELAKKYIKMPVTLSDPQSSHIEPIFPLYTASQANVQSLPRFSQCCLTCFDILGINGRLESLVVYGL